MKKYLSVFEMITRSSIYKILLTLLGMMVVEASFFYNTMQHAGGILLEEYIDQSNFTRIFKIAYIVVTIVLILPGMNIGSTQSYTLKRLRVKEKYVFWLQVLYNFFAYILLWGAQLAVVFGCVAVYQMHMPDAVLWTNQSMLLIFYKNAFLYSLLPLESLAGWFVLGVTGIMSALATAEFTRLQRKGKFGFELLFLVATAMIYFPRELSYEISFPIFVIVVLFLVMATRWVKDRGGDKHE